MTIFLKSYFWKINLKHNKEKKTFDQHMAHGKTYLIHSTSTQEKILAN